MKRKLFYFIGLLVVSATLVLVSANVTKACPGDDDKWHKMVIIECWASDENGNPMIIGYSNVCEQGNSYCFYNPCPNE